MQLKFLNIYPYLYMRNFADDWSFFDAFDEGVSSTVVCDGQTQSGLIFCELNFLWSTWIIII